MLPLLVVVAGLASMVVEMAASRLLAPFFGSSLYIWAILIGLVLIYLTIGYWAGGKLADRRPSRSLFLRILAGGGLSIAVLSLIAAPILDLTLHGTENVPYGLFWGAIAGCLILFSVPTVLLGSLNPFAIRLSVGGVERSGNAAGQVFGLTTIGSLVGTFGAVFLGIPTVGTRATLLLAAALTLAAAGLGAAVWSRGSSRSES